MVEPAAIERNPDIRYGWYLRPSFEMSRDLVAMHELVRRQFGLICGGAFMPHATLKGFFRSDASLDDILAACARAIVGRVPFAIYNPGPVGWGRSSIVIDVQETPDGQVNAPLQALHEAGWKELAPLVHRDCTFTPIEGAMENFRAHLTLVMADMNEELFDEVMQFIKDTGPIGPGSFTAEYVHLYAFQSQDWTGRWWESLEWSLLKSWRLGG